MPTEPAGLCRDCLAPAASSRASRCPDCGSARLLRHPELHQLTIAHVDCDAFYATIEKRDDASLRDKPLIIGGGKRGVVATCCYIARTFGVHSAMPMFKALKACPQAVVLPPDMTKYARIGRQVRALLRDLTPMVEPLSIDEAFLDLAGTQALHGMIPAKTLATFARRVEAEIGISVSIGLSYCKFLAKVASDLDKPRGFAVIGRSEAADFLRERPVSLIWGVGAVGRDRLARDGFARMGDLVACGEAGLLRRYGQEGGRLFRLAQGIDVRRVTLEHETKSVSAETTFAADLSVAEDLVPILHRLCEKLARRLKRADLAARGITLKLKTADFRIRTRSRSDLAATQLSTRIFEPARALLLKELDGTRFRLLGVGTHDLRPAAEADRGDLLDTGLRREKAMETAIDALRDKFGTDAILKGIDFPRRPSRR